MLTLSKLRDGVAAAGLVVSGGLAIAAAVALATAPLTPRLAAAQSAANPNDQPTAGTLPAGTSTLRGERAIGGVSPPSRIAPSTDVVSPKDGSPTDLREHLSSGQGRTAD